MNRRMFFAGLLGLPIAAKCVADDPPVRVPFNEYFDAIVPRSKLVQRSRYEQGPQGYGCGQLQIRIFNGQQYYRVKPQDQKHFSYWRRFDKFLEGWTFEFEEA